MSQKEWFRDVQLPGLSVCFKCGEPVTEKGFTVVAQGTKLSVRKVKFLGPVMHKQCAFDWIEIVACTPENVDKFPVVANAVKTVEIIEQEGKRYLEAVSSEISFRRKRVFEEIASHNKKTAKPLRIPKKLKSERDWPLRCIQSGRSMAADVDNLRSLVVGASKQLENVNAQLNWLSERFQKNPPEGINPIGWVWQSEGNLKAIAKSAKRITAYMEELEAHASVSRSKADIRLKSIRLVDDSFNGSKDTDDGIFEIELTCEVSKYPDYNAEWLRERARNMRRNAGYPAKSAVECLIRDARACDRCREDAGASEKIAGFKFCDSCKSKFTTIQLLEEKLERTESALKTFEETISFSRNRAVRIRAEIELRREQARSKFSIVNGSTA